MKIYYMWYEIRINKIIANPKSQFCTWKTHSTWTIIKTWSIKSNNSNMHLSKKSLPGINFFCSFENKTKKLPHFTCLLCQLHLNIKCAHAKEYEEAINRLKLRKVKCKGYNKNAWIYKKCKNNKVYESKQSLMRHNWQRHRKTATSNIEGNKGAVELKITNTFDFANNGCFTNLRNEETWILFSNNLHHLKLEDRKFTTTIHEKNADKYLVANL